MDGRPRALHLTAGDEIIAMENIDILNANGFDVHVDESKPAGKGERISLLAMPVSKETVFDFKGTRSLRPNKFIAQRRHDRFRTATSPVV